MAAFSQYLLKDDPIGGEPGSSVARRLHRLPDAVSRPSGAAPKPLYSAWPVPLTVTKRGHGFSLWGLVRPATGSTKLTVLVQRKGAKSYRTLKTVKTNSLGYWCFNSSTKGTAWRVRWVSPTGVKYEGPPIAAY